LALAVPLVWGQPPAGQRYLADDLQGGPFGGPYCIPVDEVAAGVARAQRSRQLLDPSPVARGQLAVLGDVLDPQVERTAEPSGNRQVRRWADGGQRLGRVQRVNQHEFCPEVTCAPGRQIREIPQVTVTPGGARPERVELDRETPALAGGDTRDIGAEAVSKSGDVAGSDGLAGHLLRHCRVILAGSLRDLIERGEDRS